MTGNKIHNSPAAPFHAAICAAGSLFPGKPASSDRVKTQTTESLVFLPLRSRHTENN